MHRFFVMIVDSPAAMELTLSLVFRELYRSAGREGIAYVEEPCS